MCCSSRHLSVCFLIFLVLFSATACVSFQENKESGDLLLLKELPFGEVLVPGYKPEGEPANLTDELRSLISKKDWDGLGRKASARLQETPFESLSLQLQALIAYQKKNYAMAMYLADLSGKGSDLDNPWLWNLKGLIQLKQAKLLLHFREAKKCFARAVEGDDGFVAARLNLGFLSLQLGDLPRALRQFEEARELCKACLPAMTGIAMTLLRTRDEREKGREMAEVLFRDHPDHVAVGYDLALFFYAGGQKEKSRAILRKISSDKIPGLRADALRKISSLEKIL